jgi:hypothetical protein
MPFIDHRRSGEPINVDRAEARRLRAAVRADICGHLWHGIRHVWDWLELSAAGLRIAERPPMIWPRPAMAKRAGFPHA